MLLPELPEFALPPYSGAISIATPASPTGAFLLSSAILTPAPDRTG
jgi:hypothetical protein